MKTKGNLIVAMGLDPAQPYSLGNKDYYYKRECNSGHKNLQAAEIAFTGGHYDGYNWVVPCCLRCIKSDKEYPHVMQHSHNTSVHLVEVKGEELNMELICQNESGCGSSNSLSLGRKERRRSFEKKRSDFEAIPAYTVYRRLYGVAV